MNDLENKIYTVEKNYMNSINEIKYDILDKVSALFTNGSDRLSIDLSDANIVITLTNSFTDDVTNVKIVKADFVRGEDKILVGYISEDKEMECEVSDISVWQQNMIFIPLANRIKEPKRYTLIRVSVALEFAGELTDEELDAKLSDLMYVFKDCNDKEINSGDMDWDVSEKRIWKG